MKSVTDKIKYLMDLLKDPYVWIIFFAALLGAASLIIIHVTNRNSAEESKKEITNVLKETTNSTILKITEATDTLVEKSKDASEKITTTISKANEKLNKQLKSIESATENLKNQIENQEILIQLEYSFDIIDSNIASDGIPIMDKMINQLSKNNYYQLKLITEKGEKSLFKSSINSFDNFNEEEYGAEFLKDAFAPVLIIDEFGLISHRFIMKIPMKTVNLSFLFNDIKTGDNLEFVLTKDLDKARDDENPVTISSHTLNGSFTPFVHPKLPNEIIVGNIDLSIRLRSGKVIQSKTIKCELVGTTASIGFRYFAEIQ